MSWPRSLNQLTCLTTMWVMTLIVAGGAAAQDSPPPQPGIVVVSNTGLPPRFRQSFEDGARQAAGDLGVLVAVVDAEDEPGGPGSVVVQLAPGDHAAGMVAGTQVLAAGARYALCLQVEAGVASYAARCAGAASTLGADGARISVLFALDPDGDPSGIRAAITGRLTAAPTIDAILVTDPSSVPTVIDAVAAVVRSGAHPTGVTIGVFDVDRATLDAIEGGDVAFAIDQQPWQQGYQAVEAATTVAGFTHGDVLTIAPAGPAVVNEANVDGVRAAVEVGRR